MAWLMCMGVMLDGYFKMYPLRLQKVVIDGASWFMALKVGNISD